MKFASKRIVNAVGILLAAFCCGAGFAAEESGQIPYATIHKAITRARAVNNPNFRPTVSIVSTDAKAAKSAPVKLVIQAKAGAMKVDVDDDGEIRSFPVTDELLKENPLVLSNQPRGKSQLRVAFAVLLPESLTLSYRLLSQRVDEANAEIKKQAGMLSLAVPRAKTLQFQFKEPAKQTITVGGKNSQVLTADSNGVIDLTIDPKIASEDPQVILSEKPAKVSVK
jgi:hypothetical protein